MRLVRSPSDRLTGPTRVQACAVSQESGASGPVCPCTHLSRRERAREGQQERPCLFKVFLSLKHHQDWGWGGQRSEEEGVRVAEGGWGSREGQVGLGSQGSGAGRWEPAQHVCACVHANICVCVCVYRWGWRADKMLLNGNASTWQRRRKEGRGLGLSLASPRALLGLEIPPQPRASP